MSADAALTTNELDLATNSQQESQLQVDADTSTQPSSDVALPDTIAGPEVLDPAASPSDGSGEQPLPEEVLAEGLIPADAPLAANNEAAPDPIASESGAVESDAAEKAAGTSGSDLPFPTGMEAGYVQLTEAEDALAASVSGTADGSELDPSGTAALIQGGGTSSINRPPKARVPTPAKEAQQATAGSRPTSTEIASQIEGFEDDFRAPQADVLSLGAVPEEAEGEEEADAEELEEVIEAAKQSKRMLAERNASLQNKVHQYLEARNKGRVVGGGGRDSRQGLDVAYLSALATSAKLVEEESRIRNHFVSQTMTLKATLEEKLKKSEELQATFRHFLTEVAKAAENSKTGRPIPHKLLADYTKEEAVKDAELQKVRLRHLMLKAQLAKIEHRVKQKEELAEGLHLIDFEQLKIENQSLNEKIEERNEELAKLKKKTATTVQILTHVKEKLQFAQKEKEAMQAELDSVESALATHRDDLGRVKLARDKALLATRKLKDAVSHVSNTSLLADLEACKDKRTTLLESMDKVKLSYSQITAQTTELTQQVLHMTSQVRSQVEASDMGGQQARMESLSTDNMHGPMLNSRATTGTTASRPRTTNPALSRSKAASRARSQLSNVTDLHVEYIPALKLE